MDESSISLSWRIGKWRVGNLNRVLIFRKIKNRQYLGIKPSGAEV